MLLITMFVVILTFGRMGDDINKIRQLLEQDVARRKRAGKQR